MTLGRLVFRVIESMMGAWTLDTVLDMTIPQVFWLLSGEDSMTAKQTRPDVHRTVSLAEYHRMQARKAKEGK